jgi:hypothetical protein
MNDSTRVPTTLERAVIELILKGDDQVKEILRKQWAVSEIARRDLSGSGVFVRISVPDSAPKISEERLVLGNVLAHVPELASGIGFVLFVIDGKLDVLEGFTMGEKWPTTVSEFRLEDGAFKR